AEGPDQRPAVPDRGHGGDADAAEGVGMTAARTALEIPLRPYQVEVRRAVLASVLAGEGRSFSVEIARQGGKNELSAHLALELLLRFRQSDVTLVKAAPTFDPQAR